MDILDAEVEEDEDFQEAMPSLRKPSHEANEKLIEKAMRYKGILTQAADSDEVIRQRWLEWEISIDKLTWDEVSFYFYLFGFPVSTPVGLMACGVLTYLGQTRSIDTLGDYLTDNVISQPKPRYTKTPPSTPSPSRAS